MHKSLATLILLGLILPIIYTKGTTSKKRIDPSNAEESLDAADFWDFNPHVDSGSETIQKEAISTKKSGSETKKTTMGELEQLLKDVENVLANMGMKPSSNRALGMSVSEIVINEEEIMVEIKNDEFDLNAEQSLPIGGDIDGSSQTDETNNNDQTQDVTVTPQDETESPAEPEEEQQGQSATNPDEEVPREEEEDLDVSRTSEDELNAQTSVNDQYRRGDAGTATLSGFIEYDMPFSTFDQQAGKITFISAIASTLGVDSNLVHVTDIREGSVIFDFEITLPAGDDQAKEDSMNSLQGYADRISEAVKSEDDSLLVFDNAEILNFKVTVYTPPTPQVYTNPKDDSLIAVLVVISATIILGALGWFVYKNKQAESDMKPANKQPKYQYPGKVDSQTERLDIESKGSGSGSASAVGDDIINDKIKLFPNSPPSDSSL